MDANPVTSPGTATSPERPQYITHDDIVAVRDGQYNAQVCDNRSGRAKCAQCRQRIIDRTREATKLKAVAATAGV
jgi:hypothetical protein